MNHLIILMILILFLCGCVVETNMVVYFEDTGNQVENYKECDNLFKKACDEKPQCIGYKIRKLECDAGKCYCG